MRNLFFLIVFLFLNEAFSQGAGLNCLEIEGINIGCVSSIDHGCFLNKMKDDSSEPCNYGADFGTHYRVEGPIAFNCKSTRNTTVTREVCNSDGCKSETVTTSECIEYFPPSCQETCEGCYNNVVTANIGISRGCIICTRPRCSDEPPSAAYCPVNYNGKVLTDLAKCSANSSCPTTAIDPLGVQHPVTITKGQCPQEPPPPEEIPPPQHCPWLVDKRSEKGCEPIEEDNKNPKAFQ